MDNDMKTRGLLDRWSHLELARQRSPCSSEVISIVTEQLRIQEELANLGKEVHASAAT